MAQGLDHYNAGMAALNGAGLKLSALLGLDNGEGDNEKAQEEAA